MPVALALQSSRRSESDNSEDRVAVGTNAGTRAREGEGNWEQDGGSRDARGDGGGKRVGFDSYTDGDSTYTVCLFTWRLRFHYFESITK